LEIYAISIYMFNKTYETSVNIENILNIGNIQEPKAIVYDGTSSTIITILEEYKDLIGSKRLYPSEHNTSRVSGRLNRENKL